MSVQQRQMFAIAPVTIGWLIAVLVLVITVVLMIVGQVDLKLGLLIVGLALARLL